MPARRFRAGTIHPQPRTVAVKRSRPTQATARIRQFDRAPHGVLARAHGDHHSVRACRCSNLSRSEQQECRPRSACCSPMRIARAGGWNRTLRSLVLAVDHPLDLLEQVQREAGEIIDGRDARGRPIAAVYAHPTTNWSSPPCVSAGQEAITACTSCSVPLYSAYTRDRADARSVRLPSQVYLPIERLARSRSRRGGRNPN